MNIKDIRNSQFFQDFCQQLLAAEFEDFQEINDSRGDGGNDGYIPSMKRLFAIYCPENHPINPSYYKQKIKSDLEKAVNWSRVNSTSINEWVFITPNPLSNELNQYIVTQASEKGINNAFCWSEKHLTHLFVKHQHLQKLFPELRIVKIEEKIDALLEKQAKHDKETNKYPSSIDEFIDNCKKQVERQIKAVIGDKYIPSLYINREKQQEIEGFLNKNNVLIMDDFLREVIKTIDILKLRITIQENKIKKPLLEGKRDKLSQLEIDNLKNLKIIFENLDSLAPFVRNIRSQLVSQTSRKKIYEFIDDLENHQGWISELKPLTKNVLHNLRNCLLIKDVAGRGKTNTVCALASELVKKQPVLLITAGYFYLKEEFSIERFFQTSLGYSIDVDPQVFMNSIIDIAQSRNKEIILIIDALNESNDIALLKATLQAFFAQYNESPIKIIVTCRDIYWEGFLHSYNDFWDNRIYKTIQLGDFTIDEFAKVSRLYFKKFEIKVNFSKRAVKKLTHPLLLRFFCESHEGEKLGLIKDIRLKTLFDAYWERKISFVKEKLDVRNPTEISSFLLHIARKMRFNRDRNLSNQDITKITSINNFESKNSIYVKILDEGIILESTPSDSHYIKAKPGITFVYDEFMEYAMARDIMAHNLNIADLNILRTRFYRILKSAKYFTSIYGVVTYLLLMLDNERRFDGWSIVYSYGEKWYYPICKAIGKSSIYNTSDEIIKIALKLIKTKQSKFFSEITVFAYDITETQPEKAIQLWKELFITPEGAINTQANESLMFLANQGFEEAKNTFLFFLNHNNFKARASSIYALATIGRFDTSIFLKLMHDKSYFVREAAIYSLSLMWEEVDDFTIKTCLNKGLMDVNKNVRLITTSVINQKNYK